VIDRAGDWDGDAVPAARNRPAGGERGDTFPADSPAADNAPSDGARTDAVLTAPEQRSAAHRLYRDRVDHTYDVARIESGMDARTREADSEAREAEVGDAEAPDAKGTEARDAWAEALPGLRAAWEEHEQRFSVGSRSAPSSEADGGWLGDGDRRLTPEQNTDASKACEDIRAEGREVILPAMERVEAADPDRHLAGLQHMLKGEDRLKEKIAERLRYNPDWTAEQALEEVPDAVRFTFEYDGERYTDGVCADVDRLKTEGFELTKLKNLWEKEQYKGVNSQWRVPETGLRFEVQFHTPTSLEAKELTHKAYERIRNPATSGDEEAHLEDYQRRVNEQVQPPPRVFEIEDYPMERRDG
jgi:hypothetical protein